MAFKRQCLPWLSVASNYFHLGFQSPLFISTLAFSRHYLFRGFKAPPSLRAGFQAPLHYDGFKAPFHFIPTITGMAFKRHCITMALRRHFISRWL
jgi:hypothetical protein